MTIVYRLKLAAVMLLAASPAIALCVCVFVCRWGCVRVTERERAVKRARILLLEQCMRVRELRACA